jgi:hypothetical protein
MFKPEIRIIIDPSLKTYAVEALVVVPNGCYSAAGATLGTPAGHVTTPEAENLILNLERHDGPCTQALQVLHFRMERIPLSEGKNTVIAFVVVDDEVVGVNSRPIAGAPDAGLMSREVSQPSGIRVVSVNAYVNAMPPGPPNLIAIVNVWAPCMNYQYAFKDRGPFGFTGRTLLVEMTASLPDGVCQKAIFEGPVRFEKMLEAPTEFDSIAIAFEGQLHVDLLEIVV